MKKFLKNALAVALSAVIGCINGFFGGGGGMLLVPTLEKALGCPPKEAHATAIAVILPISIASAVAYIVGGHFSYFPVTFASVGALAGGAAGAGLLKKLNSSIVSLLFALLMAGVGIKLIIG